MKKGDCGIHFMTPNTHENTSLIHAVRYHDGKVLSRILSIVFETTFWKFDTMYMKYWNNTV